MNLIIEQLKKSIQLHPYIQSSSLSSSKKWKRAQYIILSEIISDALSKSSFLQGSRKNEIGTSISSTTLQRIFTTDYSEIETLDLRFLKSLDKLAIFIGFSTLNDFLADKSLEKAEVIPTVEKVAIEDLSYFFEKLITHYCQSEFNCLEKLPSIETLELTESIFTGSPLFKRITDLIEKLSDLRFILTTKNNRSNFELYNFKISFIDETNAVIKVSEFWNLEWRDEFGDIVHEFNKENRQTYFIKKRDAIWKIWDNYNPDYNDLSEKIALEIKNMQIKKDPV
jgi:hypothetical protein